MTSDVVLTAALRNNLLSLQNTQSAVDVTQNRLATGKKVNSALDNPQSFFASQALNNRASDLTRLLDSIGQSIQVIKAADNGVTALTKLVEQADSIAAQARDALAQGTSEASVTGNVDLRGINSLTTLGGVTDAGTDTLVFSLMDENGVSKNIGAYSTSGGSATATASITLAANFSADDLVNAINNISLEATNGSGIADGAQAFTASLDAGGKLKITANDGANYTLTFQTVADTDAANLALAQSLGFGDVAKVTADAAGAAASNVQFTAIADVALRSFALYDSTTTPDSIAQRGDQLSNLVDSSGVALFANIDNATDVYQIGVNGGTMQNIALFANGGAITIQEFIDSINNNTNLSPYIEATFDDKTGVLSIEAVSADTKNIQVGVDESVFTANFGFGVYNAFTGTAAIDISENIVLSSAAGKLAGLEDSFDNVRSQIDELVTDTGYRGTNLLNGNDLLTVFNENRTSSLTTSGVTFTADGLGLEAANFSRASTVDAALGQVRAALESVRAFGSTLANDLSIIQTRETFTKSLINTLTEGSDKLVNADQNEEGAKLLALQTRQSLGVTALSLASQSQQSILRLF